MQLSKHFKLKEFTKSQVAARNGINNTPHSGDLKNLEDLCYEVLEPIRAKFGVVTINSGFRSLELNRLLKSSDSSQHCKGMAADIEVLGTSNLKVAHWIKDNVDFDQLILEFWNSESEDLNVGWIHISFDEKGSNRKQVLTFDGKSYKNGLPEMKYRYDKMGNEIIE
jgi:hypothetical protein